MIRLVARCEAVTTKAQGESLIFDVRAITPGTKIPIYDNNLDPVMEDGAHKTFEVDAEFLERSVGLFDGGHLNLNHEKDTDFGDLTKAFYDEGLCFSAMCSDPESVQVISSGDYSGWSIEGEFLSTDEGDALKPTRLSLLTSKDPACPSNECNLLKIAMAAWDGDAATTRLIDYATNDDGEIQKSKIQKYFLVIEGDGTKKGDYGWPVGDVVDGKPAYDKAGVSAAYNAASGARSGKERPDLITKIKAIYKSEGWELPPGLQGQAQSTEDPREDWGNWGHFSIKGPKDESVSLNCYLPDVDFGDVNIKSMDIVDQETFKLLAQYIINTIMGTVSNNTGAVVMANEPIEGEFDPISHISETYGIKVESEDELKQLLDRGRKYGDLSTKLDGLKTERDELKTAKEELETNFMSLQDRQKQRDIIDAKEKVKTAFVAGLWEGEEEIEVDGETKTVPKADLMAEKYVNDPAGFYAENRKFALAEQSISPKTELRGNAASTEADEAFKARREKADANMRRAGRM